MSVVFGDSAAQPHHPDNLLCAGTAAGFSTKARPREAATPFRNGRCVRVPRAYLLARRSPTMLGQDESSKLVAVWCLCVTGRGLRGGLFNVRWRLVLRC